MKTPRQDFFVYAIGVMIFLMAVEGYLNYREQKKPFHWQDFRVNILAGLGTFGLNQVVFAALFALFELFYQLTPLRLPYTGWVFALGLVAVDHSQYWAHRFGHRTRIGWAAHVTHHSSVDYNLSVAVRQSWTQSILFWFYLPLVLVGFPPEMVFILKSVNSLYQFWIHTERIGKLPAPIEWIFNTPSHHRVHHASNERYLDKNYAGMFIFYDRIFGTFEPERAEEPVVYGLTKNIERNDLFFIQFHEWRAMFSDFWKARNWKTRWGRLFLPPGWNPQPETEPETPTAPLKPAFDGEQW